MKSEPKKREWRRRRFGSATCWFGRPPWNDSVLLSTANETKSTSREETKMLFKVFHSSKNGRPFRGSPTNMKATYPDVLTIERNSLTVEGRTGGKKPINSFRNRSGFRLGVLRWWSNDGRRKLDSDGMPGQRQVPSASTSKDTWIIAICFVRPVQRKEPLGDRWFFFFQNKWTGYVLTNNTFFVRKWFELNHFFSSR